MPPNTKVTVIRPDGTRLEVAADQAKKLELLGYRAEVSEDRVEAERAAGDSAYYSGIDQVARTVGEGLARGATLGASDYLFGDENTAGRVRENPGVAAASEIGGAVAAELVPGLNLIAPAALAGRGARAVASGSGLASKAVRGGIEGGIFGGAMAADHAYLAGDPVTTEAVLHGVGWGALFGAGMSTAGGLLSRRGGANLTKADELTASSKIVGKADDVEQNLAVREAELAQERAALYKAEQGVRAGGKRFEAAPGSYAAVAEPAFVGFRSEAKRVAQDLAESIKTTEAILGGNRKQIAQLGFERTISEGAMGRARLEVDSAFRRFSKTLNKKGFDGDKVAKAIDDYEAVVAKAADKAGLAKTGSGRQALMELAQAKVIQKELRAFPHSAEAFAKMSDKRAETLFATLGEAKKMSNYGNLTESLEAQANKLQEALGMAPNGVDGLRSAWNAARKALKAENTAAKFTDFKTQRAALGVRAADLQAERAALALEKARNPKADVDAWEPGIVRKGVAAAAGYAAYGASKSLAPGHGLVALSVGSKVRHKILEMGRPKTPELLAARNATLGRIKQAVGKFQVRAGKVTGTVGPKLSPLAFQLDGTPDTSSKDPQQLAMNRISEYAMAANHVRDTLYKGLEPIIQEQPDLGPALHAEGVRAFTALRSLMPADPGVVSGLKSIWKPSTLQAAVMGKQLEVWQDPVGAAEDMLSTGTHDPIRIKALKEFAPMVFQTLQVEMLGRIQQPGFLDKMSYRDQVALGAMLDIPIHSSMRPEFIAASQALHAQRSEPLPSPSIPGSTNGGRPADQTPGATASQISTSR